MDEIKPWYQSKTILGGIVAVGSAAAGAFGITLGPDELMGLVAALSSIGSGIGGLLAIIGRIRAIKRVG